MIRVIQNSKIKTLPIFFDVKDKENVDAIIESFDFMPYISITKQYQGESVYFTTISADDIIYVKLHNSSFLPEIEIYCDDSTGILFNDMYPFDNDNIISIFVKSNSENLLPIRMDFKVLDWEVSKNSSNFRLTYLIKGILNVDQLYFSTYISKKGTSYDVIKEIANDIGLGFASNIQNSNDSMKWISTSKTYIEFINNIVNYSWVNEDSFIWSFIDFYYRINYVEIQTQFNEFIQEDSIVNIDQFVKKHIEEKDKTAKLMLSNNDAFKGTNNYISKFNIINQSLNVNLKSNYEMKTTWYNKNKNTVFKQNIKELISDDGKLSNDEGKLRDLTDRYSKLYTENFNDLYLSKIDTDNVHENFYLAKMHNIYNINNMEKMKMVVTLQSVNFSIKRFQNIKVIIYNINDTFSKDANNESKRPEDNVNRHLSGYWLVTGINYIYRRNGGTEQEVTLMRRDLSVDYGISGNEKDDLRTDSKYSGSDPNWKIPYAQSKDYINKNINFNLGKSVFDKFKK